MQLQHKVSELQGKLDEINAPVYQKYRAFEMASYEEKIKLLDYRVKMYNGQTMNGGILMALVVVVVLTGLVLSSIQLVAAMRTGTKTDGTVDISATGIKITSSVTGLLMLAMSLALTYIYVQQVYTVHEPSIADAVKPVKLGGSPSEAKESQ